MYLSRCEIPNFNKLLDKNQKVEVTHTRLKNMQGSQGFSIRGDHECLVIIGQKIVTKTCLGSSYTYKGK